MHRISYQKHFVDGNLAGLTVACSFTEPAEDCSHAQAVLNAVTVEDPGYDFLAGDEYWISGVTCDMGEGYESIVLA